MPSVIQKWNPVTYDFGLIRAPLERVLVEFQNWHKSIGIEYSGVEISTSFDAAFESLLPLAHSKMRRLFVATRSDWVACFQNGIQGSDPAPAMSFLASKMETLAMRVCCTADSVKFPAVIWELYAPESQGGKLPRGCRRSIAAANDGGHWIFEESGERFPFEKVERYAESRKRDRFTREMLCDYLKEFGIKLFADDFFCVNPASPAIRLQRVTKLWNTPEFTLEEVVAGVPWRKAEK